MHVVRGNINQNDSQFPATARNAECTSCSVFAACYSRIVAPSTWSDSDIDKIIRAGTKLHIRTKAEKRIAHVYLAADEVLSPFKIGMYKFSHMDMVHNDEFSQGSTVTSMNEAISSSIVPADFTRNFYTFS